MDSEEFISEIYQIYSDLNYLKVIDVNNDKKSDLIIEHLDQNISVILTHWARCRPPVGDAIV
jgi:hypothetical protein